MRALIKASLNATGCWTYKYTYFHVFASMSRFLFVTGLKATFCGMFVKFNKFQRL